MKKQPTLFWCDACNKAVEPTIHSVTEKTEFWGEATWEAFFEPRCPLCTDVVSEEVACIECKEAQPESGADHCTACLAKIEAEELHALTARPQRPNPTLNAPAFGPLSDVSQIASYCGKYESTTHEVVAQIRCIGGKPVVSIISEAKPQGLDAILRRGSDLPLLRRQAS